MFRSTEPPSGATGAGGQLHAGFWSTTSTSPATVSIPKRLWAGWRNSLGMSGPPPKRSANRKPNPVNAPTTAPTGPAADTVSPTSRPRVLTKAAAPAVSPAVPAPAAIDAESCGCRLFVLLVPDIPTFRFSAGLSVSVDLLDLSHCHLITASFRRGHEDVIAPEDRADRAGGPNLSSTPDSCCLLNGSTEASYPRLRSASRGATRPRPMRPSLTYTTPLAAVLQRSASIKHDR